MTVVSNKQYFELGFEVQSSIVIKSQSKDEKENYY